MLQLNDCSNLLRKRKQKRDREKNDWNNNNNDNNELVPYFGKAKQRLDQVIKLRYLYR